MSQKTSRSTDITLYTFMTFSPTWHMSARSQAHVRIAEQNGVAIVSGLMFQAMHQVYASHSRIALHELLHGPC